MAAVMEQERDYQALVTDEIVESKYIPYAHLKYTDHDEEWVITSIEHPLLGVQEHEGVIITMVGSVKRDLATGGYAEIWQDNMGREVTGAERQRMPERGQEQLEGPFKVWDFRVREVEVTDGPEARAELLESHEQAKRRVKAEERDRQSTEATLAEAVSKLADSVNVSEQPTRRKRGEG